MMVNERMKNTLEELKENKRRLISDLLKVEGAIEVVTKIICDTEEHEDG